LGDLANFQDFPCGLPVDRTRRFWARASLRARYRVLLLARAGCPGLAIWRSIQQL
jgi:hypothetical protein